MSRDLTNGIDKAYAERIDLLVVALTGRTGSGCTTTAKAMSRPFAQIPSSSDGLTEIEKRKQTICSEFAKSQWKPFKTITVSAVILSFLLLEEWNVAEQFLKDQKVGDNQIAAIRKVHESARKHVGYAEFEALSLRHDTAQSPLAWEFYSTFVDSNASEIRSVLGNKYPALFQTLGDNIRHSGSAISKAVDHKEIFALITRVKRLARAAGKWDRAHGEGSTRVVIDAVRNPLELVYLRDQFAAFFAIAITSDDEDRRARLADRMNSSEMSALDNREYSKKSLNNYDNFVSQNLQECIQKADLFFHNPGKPDSFEQNRLVLNRQIIRYVALMMRPGLVTPTAEERCMQLAFVAKLNSGCISRQVGAVVTDASGSIKAVGWNDVPKGQIPCLLRDVGDLLGGNDSSAFSHFEKNDQKLRTHLGKVFGNAPEVKTATGLSCPYCFKEAFNLISNEKNQVHTRSLHAEENAFLQLAKYGNSAIARGVLYTTASPCELCSKKAFQLGITLIVYVDPYPGISATHVLRYGENPPTLHLFSGAVGSAYHRLYEPVLPIKDEYRARLTDPPPPQLL